MGGELGVYSIPDDPVVSISIYTASNDLTSRTVFMVTTSGQLYYFSKK